jgi:hypothetical protein
MSGAVFCMSSLSLSTLRLCLICWRHVLAMSRISRGRGCKETYINLPLLILHLYPYLVPYVHIRLSHIRSDIFVPILLGQYQRLIHSQQPSDINDLTQLGHLPHKPITFTNDILV